MKDVIGASHMQQGSGTTFFVADRFGNPNSALALNGGWTYVPSGVFFNTIQFTITAWIYPQNIGFWSRLIDFGNGQTTDNVLLAFDAGNNTKPSFGVYSGGVIISQVISSQTISLNQWQFLSATYDGSTIKIYINGALTASAIFAYTPLSTMTRTKNYIGKSNWNLDSVSSAYIDDLRFYNIRLSQTQIQNLMNQADTSSSYLSCKPSI